MVRRAVTCVVLALVAISVLGPASAHASGSVQIRRVDTSRYPQVAVTISVENELVAAGDVKLTENGVRRSPTQVHSFGSSDGGVDVVLAIDTSNSMRGDPVANAFAAARTFLSRVPSWVHVGVMTFAARPRVLAPVSSSRVTLRDVLGSAPPTTKGTALYDAVVAATKMFGGQDQRNVVLLTDGQNTAGSGTLEDALAAATDASTAVFTIGLRGEQTDEQALTEIATGTGGLYAGASAGSLDTAYQTLATRFSRQYVVTYGSSAAPGTNADIRVSVGDSADTASFIVPFPRATGAESRSALAAFLDTSWGLVLVLVICFVTFLLVVDQLLGRRFRGRRQRELAGRMLAATSRRAPRGETDERRGPLAWIPDPLAFAAENAAPGEMASRVARSLERAGVAVRPGEFLAVCGLAAVAGAALGAIVLPWPIVGLLVGVATGAIPPLILSRRVERRLRAFQEQLPDVLTVLATSLRAGHSFMQALDTVTREADDPAAPEFARVLTESRLGRPVDEALQAAADRMGSDDFDWAVMAITIQRQVGGNLAEVLETVSGACRERELIRRQVRVLSAEGRLSVAILIAMPFFLALYLFFVNRRYLLVLVHSSIGVILLGAAAILMVVGFVWMRKIVRIDV